MKLLFVNSHAYYSEPLGIMQISAICKAEGHETKLAIISDHSMKVILDKFKPDIIGYSAMSPNEHLFVQAHKDVKEYTRTAGKPVLRIMGGPHPTFFPEIIDTMDLDAIVVGDGDRAIVEILRRFEEGKDLNGIPNVITKENRDFEREVIEDMDELPPFDRDVFYDAAPKLQRFGVRSFLTQRGCPYKCTYCFNSAWNLMFKGGGRKLIRRRSVDHLIKEVKQVVKDYPPVRFIRFADDVFVIRRDEWLEEFAEKFPKEVGLPFYCLIRASALTEEVAELLAKAGCNSVSMSIEAGTEELRNVVLKRNMSDEQLTESFRISRKYGIRTHSNSIMGLPGTTIEDDFQTFLFAKKMRPTAPQFGVFAPYPKAPLTEYAKELGLLADDFDYNTTHYNKSVLNNYTEEEAEIQLRLSYLAAAFCYLPNFMIPVLRVLIKLPLTRFYSFIEATVETYIRGILIFPGAHPRNPFAFIQAGWSALYYIFKNARS